jgi:hypothetical protein
VSLNVGGKSGIKVYRSVLTSVPESALAKMFSGKFDLDEVDGEVYIDRDPYVFDMVLQYLRNGKEVQPMDHNVRKLFDLELEFWLLNDHEIKEKTFHEKNEMQAKILGIQHLSCIFNTAPTNDSYL